MQYFKREVEGPQKKQKWRASRGVPGKVILPKMSFLKIQTSRNEAHVIVGGIGSPIGGVQAKCYDVKCEDGRAVAFYCNCVDFWCQHFDVGWVRLWYQFRLPGGGFWMASVWVPRGPPGGVKRDNSHME